ncbi:Jerky protein-like 17, partial [Homarus americanus]
MSKLNVYWEKTGYMSTELSKKWFDDCFVKDAKEYCRMKNVAVKQEEVKEVAETVSNSEEEDPPLATALPGSPTASASTPPPGSPATPATPAPPGIPSTSTMTVTAFWKNYNICQAVNFFVKAWGNTTKATIRHAWSALLPQLKSAETKTQQPAELMNQVLETIRSIPAPAFQEVTREDLEELMQEGNTNDVEDLLEDEGGGESGDAASDAGETEQRKVTTQKLSLLLGVCTSLQEMIQDIENESGEREQMIEFVESISRKYQRQYNERVNARQQSLITRFLSQRRPAEEDQQREVEVDEDIGEMPEDFDFAGFDEVLAEVGELGARGQGGTGTE